MTSQNNAGIPAQEGSSESPRFGGAACPQVTRDLSSLLTVPAGQPGSPLRSEVPDLCHMNSRDVRDYYKRTDIKTRQPVLSRASDLKCMLEDLQTFVDSDDMDSSSTHEPQVPCNLAWERIRAKIDRLDLEDEFEGIDGDSSMDDPDAAEHEADLKRAQGAGSKVFSLRLDVPSPGETKNRSRNPRSLRIIICKCHLQGGFASCPCLAKPGQKSGENPNDSADDEEDFIDRQDVGYPRD